MKYVNSILQFYQYVCEFYNSTDGIYPIASRNLIGEAIDEYLESKPLKEICFDSHDREMVREIIEKKLVNS